jgi:hypothetical protein
MARLQKFIIAAFCLLVFAQCKKEVDTDKKAAAIFLPEEEKTRSFFGEWKFVNSIWYFSELTLNDDGTFKFHDQGCYGQKFSQGKWTNNNDIIQLESFVSFRQQELNEANKVTEVVEEEGMRRRMKVGEIEYSFVGFDAGSSLVFPGPNDTVRIYLNKVQLELKNDTLYCVGSEKLPEAANFYRAKNAVNISQY